jgi:ribosome maturation factor RimP
MYHDMPPRLRELVEPIVDAHGLELVDAEAVGGPGSALVRVVVDTPAGDGRVAIERCAEVSREIGTSLDADGSYGARYRLEVASPGLDRVLAREKDFAAACGSEVKIETRRPVAGRRHFRGELEAFEGGVARVRVDGVEFEVPFAEIGRANQVYRFSAADFGGKDRKASKGSRHEPPSAAGEAS